MVDEMEKEKEEALSKADKAENLMETANKQAENVNKACFTQLYYKLLKFVSIHFCLLLCF